MTNNQEWHDWRSQGIGASDAAIVLKMFPFGKTPYMLWEDKVSGTKQLTNKAMEHGNTTEPRAMEWTKSQLGVELIGQKRVEHPSMPWMRATLDGMDSKNRFIVEIKCPYNLDNHQKVKESGRVPDIYWPQVQHQLGVTQLNHMYFVSYNHKDPDDSIVIEVERDESFLENLIREEYAFFQYVVDRIPPPLTDLDYKNRDGAWIEIAKERMAIREMMSELKGKDEKLQKLLIEESEGMSSRGGDYTFTKYISKGRIDYCAALSHYVEVLRANFPDLELPSEELEIFRKDPVTSWKLT
jgi:putative phage-type endonuclease